MQLDALGNYIFMLKNQDSNLQILDFYTGKILSEYNLKNKIENFYIDDSNLEIFVIFKDLGNYVVSVGEFEKVFGHYMNNFSFKICSDSEKVKLRGILSVV